jgi:hypothetical protein
MDDVLLTHISHGLDTITDTYPSANIELAKTYTAPSEHDSFITKIKMYSSRVGSLRAQDPASKLPKDKQGCKKMELTFVWGQSCSGECTVQPLWLPPHSTTNRAMTPVYP